MVVSVCGVFAAIDILKSGTRKDDLFVDKGMLAKMYVPRRILAPMGTVDAIEFLLDKLKSSKTNSDFFESMNAQDHGPSEATPGALGRLTSIRCLANCRNEAPMSRRRG